MRLAKISLLLVFSLFTLFSAGGICEANRIESITVKVIDANGTADETILQRMATSMQAVAEQIIAGKESSYLAQNEYVYQTILTDIGNRVFIGYDTERIAINQQTGSANIIVYVRPWQFVTAEAKVNVYLSGIDPMWNELIKDNIAGLESDVAQILKGIPVDAVDWAGVLAKNLVRDTVGQKLPSFKANIDIVPGEIVTVDIVLIPVGKSVQDVNYELHSNTMPTLVLLDARTTLGDYAKTLRGMPLDFLNQNRDKIQLTLTKKAQEERIVKNYHLNVDVDIEPKNDTNVVITLDSSKYRFWIEGYLDISRDEDNISGKAHIGKFISDKDEFFLETTVYINNIKWKFDPGISRDWGKTRLSLLYRFPDHENILRLEYKFLKNWQLRVEKFAHTSRPEFGLRYRIHEFLAVELIFDKDKESYVRIVGNL